MGLLSRLFLIFAIASGISAYAADSVQYRVPVRDPDLKPFAVYDVSDYTAFGPVGDSLDIGLPEELVGKSGVQFHLKKGSAASAAFASFTDGKNVALCGDLEARPGQECLVVFERGSVDEAGVRSALEAQGKTEEEILARLRVSAAFERDPIGVISFPVRR